MFSINLPQPPPPPPPPTNPKLHRACMIITYTVSQTLEHSAIITMQFIIVMPYGVTVIQHFSKKLCAARQRESFTWIFVSLVRSFVIRRTVLPFAMYKKMMWLNANTIAQCSTSTGTSFSTNHKKTAKRILNSIPLKMFTCVIQKHIYFQICSPKPIIDLFQPTNTWHIETTIMIRGTSNSSENNDFWETC